MASPLRWFRRHAKILMVVLGSVAMAIFGLGNVLTSLSDPAAFRERPADQVLARWNGGELTRNDLSAMQTQHYQTLRFLEQLESQAIDLKKDDFRSLAQPIAPLRGGERTGQAEVDEQLIERFILAKKAEKEGIVVSDGVIDDYLQMVSSYAGFSKNDLVRINQNANQGRCSLEGVKRHLRLELLAQQMRLYTLAGLPMVPNPLEGAQLYQQMSERIECEVLPVSVEEYFTKLDGQPPKLDLKKLYEEGKFDYPDPTGKNPGFKIPNKVAIQYMTADFETFMQNEMNKLTDEQVQTEYDRLVKEKDDLVMEVVAEEADDSFKTNDPPPGLPGLGEDKSENDPAPAPPIDDASKAESPDENAKPAAGDADKKDQSLIVRQNKTQLVSLALPQDKDEKAATGGKEDELKLADAASASDQAKSQEQPKADAESTQNSPVKTGEVTSDKKSETPPATQKSADPIQDVAPVKKGTDEIGSLFADSEEKEVEKRVLPLKDVLDKVKRNMVQKSAFDAMEESTKKTTALLTGYHTLRMKWEFTDESKRGPVPEPLDIKTLADKYNLIANETKLLDYSQLSEMQFGMTDVPISVPGPNGQPQMQFVTVARVIFDRFDDLKVYDAQSAQDFRTGNSHVYWLKEKEDAKIPEFDECLPAIEKFWKSRRALELAREEANKIAARVNSEKKSLTELYGERVSPTGEFSWFNTLGGSLYGQPQGVIKPGQDFMHSVFALKNMEAGAAANEPKSVVYVVQMLTNRKSIEDLGTEYIEKKYLATKKIPREIAALSNFYGQDINIEWNQELADEMGLKIYGR